LDTVRFGIYGTLDPNIFPQQSIEMKTWQVLFVLFICGPVQVILCLTYNYGDGSFYVGEVDEQGRPFGIGRFYNTSGNLEYEGEFMSGVPHGVGKWFGADGSVYHGKFRFGRSFGHAVMIKANGDRIEGNFLDMKPHGTMVITSGDNSQMVKIEGQFRYGMAHGKLRLWFELEEEEEEDDDDVGRSGKDDEDDEDVGRSGKEEDENDDGNGSKPGTMTRVDATFRMGLPHGTVEIRPDPDPKEDEESSESGETSAANQKELQPPLRVRFLYGPLTGRPFLLLETRQTRRESDGGNNGGQVPPSNQYPAKLTNLMQLLKRKISI